MSEEQLTRREMLARGAGAVLAAGVAAAGGYLLYEPQGDAGLRQRSRRPVRLRDYCAGIELPASGPRIGIGTADGQPSGSLAPEPSLVRESLLAPYERLVRAAIGGLDPDRGMRRFVTPGDVVLIKPNVGFDRPPHLGATTHPEVLRWVIRLCREAGAREIIVADHPIESPEACFARSGIRAVVEEEGAEAVWPTGSDFENVVLRRRADRQAGEALESWPVFTRPLRQATKLIGVAPVKDHNLCSASMTLKNWYGLLGGRRNQLHQAIHEVISDLALLLRPTLVIADATRVMMRSGPTGGRVSDVRPGGVLGRPAVIASVDPVACDAWCYEHLLGRDPAQLHYLDLARAKIAAQVAAGIRRMAECNWRVYEQRGLVVTRGT
jgi:uncharacterized protein (DUF362 family)